MKDIDKKLNDTLTLYTASGIEQQVDYNKFYLYSLVTHSTAIEGSTITEVENQLLFDEGITAKGKSIVDFYAFKNVINILKQLKINLTQHVKTTD